MVADVAVKTFEFRIAAAERRAFFRRLGSFLDASNIDRVGRGAIGSGRYDSSLVNFLAEFDLIDWYRLDHPGREM